MHYFYILYSAILNRYYIGYTSDDLNERIRRHNNHHKGFTGNVGDWYLCYSEPYTTKQQATAREKQVKGWKSRKLNERLIRGVQSNPD